MNPRPMEREPVRILLSAAPEDHAFAKAFRKHLANLERERFIAVTETVPPAGEESRRWLDDALRQAQVLVPLLSADHMTGERRDLMDRAMNRHAAGTLQVWPLIIRPCDWTGSLGVDLEPLGNPKPIGTPGNHKGWLASVEELKRLLDRPLPRPKPIATKRVAAAAATPSSETQTGTRRRPRSSASPPDESAGRRKATHTVDVVIVTALKEEYDQARKVDEGALGDWEVDRETAGLEIAFRSYQSSGGEPLRVALTWATKMRTIAAADLAGRLSDQLGPRCLAMCGVCAGRRGKVEPGDVIIGSLLYTYDTGSLKVEYDEDGSRHERFQAETDTYPLGNTWLQRAQAFALPDAHWVATRPPTLAAQCNWVLARLRAKEDPLHHAERPQRCPAWQEMLERLRKLKLVTAKAPLAITNKGVTHLQEIELQHAGSLPTAPPFRTHVAPIATGNHVMRDPKLFDKLSDAMRTVLGVEMEAAGIAAAAHARGLPWIVMKGVMDHADHDKDDQLKPFAARASAECLIAFLRENLPLVTRGSRTSRRRGPSEKTGTPPQRSEKEADTRAPEDPREPESSPAPDSSLQRHLADLEADVARQLRGLPEAAAKLAVALGVAPTNEHLSTTVTRSLIHEKTGKQAVMALNVADEALKLETGRLAERRALRKLLLQTLPFTADWRPYVRRGRAALAQGTARFVDLPLGTDTMREAMLAGIDLRSCRYEIDDPQKGPSGKALLRSSAADRAFIAPRRLAEATVGLLAIQLFGLSPDDPALQNHAAMRTRVNDALQFYSEVAGDEYLPRWLLVDDELLDHIGTPLEAAPSKRLALAVAVLSGELPHLRILCPGAGVDGETYVALGVGALLRKPLTTD